MLIQERELDVSRIKKHRRFQKKYLPLAETAVDAFQDKIIRGENVQILVSRHGNKREFERCISHREIMQVIEEGYPIEFQGYNRDSMDILMMSYVKIGKKNYRPLHVAIAVDKNYETVIVKTAYDPRTREWQWEKNYQKRLFYFNKVEQE